MSQREETWRIRIWIFFSLLLLWSILALGRAFWLAGPGRQAHITAGERMARFSGQLPAVRGRILDRAGRALAWSERYFDLFWIPVDGTDPNPKSFTEIQQIVADLLVPNPPEASAGNPVLLKRNLSTQELLALEAFIKSHREYQLKSRVERIRVNHPVVRGYLGSVEQSDGILVGTSGLEAEYDEVLRGKPGRFEVMLDRRRNWIPGSWKQLEEPIQGKDVVLSETLETLESRLTGAREAKP